MTALKIDQHQEGCQLPSAQVRPGAKFAKLLLHGHRGPQQKGPGREAQATELGMRDLLSQGDATGLIE